MAGACDGREPRLSQGRGLGGAHGATGGGCRAGALEGEMSDGGARLFRGGGRAREHGNTGGAAGITGSGQGRCPSVTQKSSLRGGRPFSVFLGRYPPC